MQKIKKIEFILFLLATLVIFSAYGCTPGPGDFTITYNDTIEPVMSANCLPCHLSNSVSGGVILDTYDGVKKEVKNTRLVNTINHNAGYSPMPQGEDKLSKDTIDKIHAWIRTGSYENSPSDGVFIQPFRSCQGLEPGDDLPSDDSLVCTNVAISGSTEEGRSFMDYGSCDVVLTQRPYWYKSPFNDVTPGDARLEDPDFVNELEWINSQVRASGCICCHDSASSGRRGAVWDIATEGVWTDMLSDQGVAILSGKVSSDILGKFDTDDNNGFDRDSTGFPTTDVQRVQAFFNNELDRRGVTDADIAAMPPFGSFLIDIIDQEPGICAANEGITADGLLIWRLSDARYIYVKETGTENPGVPPSNDNPEGVLWRLDVRADHKALASGVLYGSLPEGTYQVTPEDELPPSALESGKQYHLYVLKDILQPACNCIFTAP